MNTTNNKKQNKLFSARIVIIALSVLLIIAVVTICILLSDKGSSEVSPPSPSPSDENYIVYHGTSIPIAEGVDENEHSAEAFSSDGGFITYSGDARYGIDVSSHQGEIDWNAVAASGIDFAIIRVAYRGYTVGALNYDNNYEANLKGAIDAGLDVGVYVFSQAISKEEALEEAQFVLDAIKPYDITYPVIFDWELVKEDDVRTTEVTKEDVTAFAIEFCEAVENAGYLPAIYFNTEVGYMYYDFNVISERYFWFAEYNTAPSFYYNFHMWQYSQSGTVDGIEGAVDLNIAFADFTEPDTVFTHEINEKPRSTGA